LSIPLIDGTDLTYLCYEGRALECADTDATEFAISAFSTDKRYEPACIASLRKVFTDTWIASTTDITLDTPCGGYDSIDLSADTGATILSSDEWTALGADACSMICYQVFGYFMSLEGGDNNVACTCVDAPFEATCSADDEVAGNA
jgi:hypothetical protein